VGRPVPPAAEEIKLARQKAALADLNARLASLQRAVDEHNQRQDRTARGAASGE